MVKKFALLIILSLCIVGCQSKGSYDHVTRFHDDGRAKPVVAFVPVFDRSGAKLGWSLSEEFTEDVRSRLLKRSNFFLKLPDELNEQIATLSAEDNPFTTDTDWVKETFAGAEYVIFTELVEHDIHPKPLKGNFLDKITPSSELSLVMRVRIFDLRGESPEVILQEFVQQTHLIPKPAKVEHEQPDKWKKLTFSVTPMGLAHAQFSKEVASRIEDYILLSKSQ